MTNTLPTGVSSHTIAAALSALESLLGSDVVHTSPEARAEARDPYRLLDGPLVSDPSAVLTPATTEEIQTILRIATEFGVPVWTSSQGRNYGYGGSEPRVSGSFVLNLRRMNRILEINDELGYVELEPGVTFFDLYEALAAGGHKWWISCPDLGWGSVIGNALEYGVGYTPMGDHASSICGMEVVLADGTTVRTGTGGMTGTKNWHAHKRGFGPSIDGLFAQSNLGVVTRVGMWLMPQPEAYAPGAVMVDNESDLEALIDTVRPLMLDGTIQGYPLIIHAFAPVSSFLPREMWENVAASGTEAELKPIVDQIGLGFWTMRMALYGHKEIVAANRSRVEAAFAAIPGARVMLGDYEAPYNAETVASNDQVPAGIPNMEVLNFTMAAYGGEEFGGHLDFSPVTPLTGSDAVAVYRELWRTFTAHDIRSAYSLLVRDRSILHVNMLMFDRRDSVAIDNAYAACRELVDSMAALGFGEYRSHQDFADEVADKYDFNDHALGTVLTRLKDALDPAGILSPGKQGVWPSGYLSTHHDQER